MVVLAVSAAAYSGAGLQAVLTDRIDWNYVGIVHGSPLLLIALGVIVRGLSRRALRTSAAKSC